MNFLHGGRASGKTVILVKQSAATGTPIMVSTYIMARSLEDCAKMLGLEIPHPIIWRNSQAAGGYTSRVLVDNGEILLNRILQETSGHICETMSISDPIIHLTNCFLDSYMGIPQEYKGGRLEYADATEFQSWKKENIT